MRLIELHRGHIRIETQGRTATIDGEGFLQNVTSLPDYVDYVLYANTLVYWDQPWAAEPLPPTVKAAILDFLRQYFAQRGQRLAIE